MKKMPKLLLGLSVSAPLVLILLSNASTADSDMTKMPTKEALATATLAGGCFWCTESDLEQLDGVIDVVSGYSGGHVENPNYYQVSSGTTGHIEVIKVDYDPSVVSYEEVLDHFFRHIDPTDPDGSFVDRGKHYRPAVFYHNQKQKEIASNFIMEIDKAMIFPKPLQTELIAFDTFYPAEDYHQDYYKKSSLKYKYYRHASGRDKYLDQVFGEDRKANPIALRTLIDEKNTTHRYSKLSEAEIKAKLTDIQYYVTQEDGTERPFNNEYWDNKEAGIYVDIVSGEPLFSSTDKYKSGTGWPSFTKPINDKFVVTTTDYKLFYPRTEVRSKIADSHLGHVFEDGPKPTGLRYCMNSAAMDFVPVSKMASLGYSEYLYLFE